MNISGFALVYFMRATQKSNGLNNKFKQAQAEWLKLMPKKLLLSLMLTPLTDRFIMALFNVQRKSTKESDEELYGAYSDEGSGLTKEQRLESVEQLILFFKFCMVLGMYAYSTYAKWYRESN